VWLHGRVLCRCKPGCEVVVENYAGSGDDEDKQIRWWLHRLGRSKVIASSLVYLFVFLWL